MNQNPIWNQLKASLLHFLYPSCCLHCGELLEPSNAVCCSHCASLLSMIDLSERCPTCFGVDGSDHCQRCIESPLPFVKVGAVFDYLGPAATLVRKLKYSNLPYLAKGLGAFLVAQFEQLSWPIPDAIVPVPISWSHWFERGYNQSFLLAEEMSKLLSVPVWDVLKRKSGDYSQAGLRLSQRRKLQGHSIKLKHSAHLQDKIILLIDDVMTSGSTLRRCGEALLEGCPDSLYALTVCQAAK